MKDFLGIDTSNYTTSASIFSKRTNNIYQYNKKIKVLEGNLGLRQSDAVFEHVKALPDIISILMSKYAPQLQAVGVSVSPRDAENSYMPCFLVGKSIADAVAATHNISCHYFSHQAGHIMAALYSSGQTNLLNKDFIAFHISGGTTEMLLVKPSKEKIMNISIISKTLDVSAGQIIDRVGKMMQLSFPAGIELEALALRSNASFISNNKAYSSLKGADCNLSGLENKCRQYLDAKMNKFDVARFCLDSISETIINMIKAYGSFNLPIVFSGGVMANSIIKNNIINYFNKQDIYFASPEYSTDNAVGIAILASIKERMTK